jgi:hypothetical protein
MENINYFKYKAPNKTMKLQPKDPTDYRIKTKRPGETKHISLDRIARGIVEDSSSILFKVSLSGKTRNKKYNPSTFEESPEEHYESQRRKILLFKEEDSRKGSYKKPNAKITVRCIYRGDKDSLFPYQVFDMNWNLLWEEK